MFVSASTVNNSEKMLLKTKLPISLKENHNLSFTFRILTKIFL